MTTIYQLTHIPDHPLYLREIPKPAGDVVPVDGKWGIVNLNYDQRWEGGAYHVSRPTLTGAPRFDAKGRPNRGLPDTARFVVDREVILTSQLQQWIHLMNWGRGKQSETEAKLSFQKMFSPDVAFTNKWGAGEQGEPNCGADYVNRTNLDKDPIRFQPMVTGGALLKITGSKTLQRVDCWEFEAINALDDFRRYTPESHPWLFFKPTISAREPIYNDRGIWDGKYTEWYSEPFPHYNRQTVLPVLAVGMDYNYLPKWRMTILMAGAQIPSAFRY